MFGSGQSAPTSDLIADEHQRLSNKTSLTPSDAHDQGDAHNVVIQVCDVDLENNKGSLGKAKLKSY